MTRAYHQHGSDWTDELAFLSAEPDVMLGQHGPDGVTPLRRTEWVAAQSAEVNLDAAQRAAAEFLGALGLELDREELRATPARMARAYAELFQARPLNLTTFPNDAEYDELVLATRHPVPDSVRAPPPSVLGGSTCRLPARRAHRRLVQARPTGRAFRGPPANSGAVHQAGRRLPRRPARPSGAGVVLRAEHSCMNLRGVRALGATTVTTAFLGRLRTDGRARAEFFALAGVPA